MYATLKCLFNKVQPSYQCLSPLFIEPGLGLGLSQSFPYNMRGYSRIFGATMILVHHRGLHLMVETSPLCVAVGRSDHLRNLPLQISLPAPRRLPKVPAACLLLRVHRWPPEVEGSSRMARRSHAFSAPHRSLCSQANVRRGENTAWLSCCLRA